MSQKPETLSRYRSKKARTLSSRSGPKIRGWTGDDRFLDPERQARIQADRGGGGRTDLLVCAGEALADDLALEGAALVEGEVLVVLRHPRLALLVHEQHEPDRHLVLSFSSPPLRAWGFFHLSSLLAKTARPRSDGTPPSPRRPGRGGVGGFSAAGLRVLPVRTYSGWLTRGGLNSVRFPVLGTSLPGAIVSAPMRIGVMFESDGSQKLFYKENALPSHFDA